MKPSWKRGLRLLFTSLLLPAVIACGGGSAAPAKQAPAAQPSGQVIELTYATFATESNAFSQFARDYMAELEKRTNGAVRGKSWNYAEALCKAADMLKCVANRTADFGFIAPSYFPADMPYSSMTEMIYSSHVAGADGLTREELWQTHAGYQEEFKRNKVYPL